MKYPGLPFSLLFAFLIACSDVYEPSVVPECMMQKIEAFKTETNAAAVIAINAPFDKLYWFKTTNIPIDAGESVFTEECEWYCNFDCYCAPGSRCDEDLLNFPKDTIWRK